MPAHAAGVAGAGLATTPYAAFHFHRVTPYGVLANLAAMPVVSVLVMPAGLLGLVAMPFGFDGLFWAIMGVGFDWMIVVTQWVAALPGALTRNAKTSRQARRLYGREAAYDDRNSKRCGLQLERAAAEWETDLEYLHDRF